MAIQNLPTIDTIASTDQVPIYSGVVDNDARVSIGQLTEAVTEGFVPSGGLLALSTFYSMKKAPVTPAAISIGTSYANFTNYDVPAIVTPAGRTSITASTTAGEFTAQRDLNGVMFWVAMTAAWPVRELTLAILLGPDATPYEATAKYINSGRGAGLISAVFSSPVANRNNPDGVIYAGEKIRLVAKMDVADTLTLTRAMFYISTLDGI